MANEDICGTRPEQHAAGGLVGTIEQAIAGKAEQAWNATCQEAQHLGANVAQSAEHAWNEVDRFARGYPLMVFVGGFALGFLARQALLSSTPNMTRRMSQFSA